MNGIIDLRNDRKLSIIGSYFHIFYVTDLDNSVGHSE